MNAHALEVLEFDAALAAVAARAGGRLGREALLGLRPGTDVEGIRWELDRVAEALERLEAHPDWAPPVPPEAWPALRPLETEGGVLEPSQLLVLLRLLEASRNLSRALLGDHEDRDSPVPDDSHLALLARRLAVLEAEEVRIGRTVDDEAGIRDGASPALRSARKRLRGARARIVQRLDAYLAGLPARIRVPDASVSVRDGRYVVPVRREGRSEVGGVIHGESASGATLFVEPPLALELMNELRDLEREERIEVRRILREVTGRLRPHHGALVQSLEALVDFDTLHARALAARAWRASRPDLLDQESGELRVVDGRHPLLLEAGTRPVVPFDLELEPGERALVVSGPNTGGKTVFLKAMGLIPLLAQSGIFPPVGPGTRLPVVRDVFADIGDEQSIAESLSTFSAHLANAREILEGAGPGTLVLMDEMGTGTDPAEGAALARATLETLVERGARAVVTSHLGALKRLDSDTSGIVNASLLFDPDRLEPTFRLRKGRPGRSYGLAIARRLGFPGAVLDLAEGYVDQGELEVEALLESMQEKEAELTRALAQAEAAREEADRLSEEAQRARTEVEARERAAEARAREEARRFLLEAREEVERAIQEVRETEGDRAEAETRARRRVEEAARRQAERTPRRTERPRRAGRGDPLSEGDRVRVLGSGAKGVVRSLRDERVTVEVGGVRLRLPRAEVELVEGGTPRPPRAATVPEADVAIEADLRGLRVDEVELELGRALDGAVLGDLDELRIIHGKGTGAVKARVRELLERDARVREFRPGGQGEGGHGVTVALLR